MDKCARLLCGMLVVLLGAAGCGNLGKPAPRYALYDLGRAQPLSPQPAVVPERVDTEAPPWMRTAAMHYRLDYQTPPRRDAYAESRWVAPPAEMVGHALDRALTGDAVATHPCRLRVELDEFIQVFESDRASHATLSARASLLPERGDVPLARETFTVREPTPTPDAEGGVLAFRRAVPQLAQEIANWLGGLDRDSAQRLNTTGRCRR